jgi:hypothetical protein
LTAVALAVALGALVALDAGTAAGAAWYATATAVLILTVGLVVASSVTVQWSVALLAAMLLLRHHDRLVLAPLYGACLLLVAELAQRSLELRGRELIGPGVIVSRLAAVVVLAAVGGCAAAVAAIAVTIAPGRSVGFSAAGTLAAVGAFAAIVLLARRRHQQDPGEDEAPNTRAGR